MTVQSKLTVILHADVVDSTALVQVDERLAHEKIQAAFACLSEAIADGGGSVREVRGDALVATFDRASDAAAVAIACQAERQAGATGAHDEMPVTLRVGIALGEVVIADQTVTGAGVVLAQRVEQLAPPGGVCLTAAVREALPERLGFDLEDLGEKTLKGFVRPQRVFVASRLARPRVSDQSIARPPSPGIQEGTRRPSIAVLPFECIVDDRILEYLGLGLTEDLTTLLARIPGFLVISRASAFAYKGQRTDAPQVARELGVRYVVEGTLRPVGRDVRLSVQLVDAEVDAHLWAERFDRPADEVLDLQDEITQAIVGRIEPELARAELSRLQRRPAGNLDAWDLYQQAHGLLSLKGWAASTFEESIDLLRQAIALDEDFALAHAYLSLLLAISHMFQLGRSTLPFEEQAVNAVNRAVELDGRDSSVLGYAGCALCDIGQSRRGTELLERAIEADPSNAQAWAALGVGLLRLRKPREGVEKLRHGIRISPMDTRLAYWGTILANALFRLRDYDEALKEAQLACRRNDRFANSRVVLAMILAHQGRPAEAAAAMAEARRIFPDLARDNVAGLIGNRGVKILGAAGLLG